MAQLMLPVLHAILACLAGWPQIRPCGICNPGSLVSVLYFCFTGTSRSGKRALESASNSQTAQLRDKAPGGLTGLTFSKQTPEQGPCVNLAQLSAVHIDADTLPALEKGAGKHVLRYLLACQRSRCDQVPKSLCHYTERLTTSTVEENLLAVCEVKAPRQRKVQCRPELHPQSRPVHKVLCGCQAQARTLVSHLLFTQLLETALHEAPQCCFLAPQHI